MVYKLLPQDVPKTENVMVACNQADGRQRTGRHLSGQGNANSGRQCHLMLKYLNALLSGMTEFTTARDFIPKRKEKT